MMKLVDDDEFIDDIFASMNLLMRATLLCQYDDRLAFCRMFH